MKKELIDFVGADLFGRVDNKKLLLKSNKQFTVKQDGSLEIRQSVVTDIIVTKDAIYLTYLLADGHKAQFVNAVTDVHYRLNNDYIIDKIIYTTTAIKGFLPAEPANLQFTISCGDEELIFSGEQQDIIYERTIFEINQSCLVPA